MGASGRRALHCTHAFISAHARRSACIHERMRVAGAKLCTAKTRPVCANGSAGSSLRVASRGAAAATTRRVVGAAPELRGPEGGDGGGEEDSRRLSRMRGLQRRRAMGATMSWALLPTNPAVFSGSQSRASIRDLSAGSTCVGDESPEEVAPEKVPGAEGFVAAGARRGSARLCAQSNEVGFAHVCRLWGLGPPRSSPALSCV